MDPTQSTASRPRKQDHHGCWNVLFGEGNSFCQDFVVRSVQRFLRANSFRRNELYHFVMFR